MRVHIEGDIYLSSNGSDGTLGYSIEKRSVVEVKDKETGNVTGTKEVFTPMFHYTTIAEAINHGLLRKKIAESSTGTLKELLAEMELIRQEIMAAIQI